MQLLFTVWQDLATITINEKLCSNTLGVGALQVYLNYMPILNKQVTTQRKQ